METVVVTLKLPKDLYSLLQKYGKALIVNEQFSNNIGIKNTSVLNTNILENPEEKKIPSLNDVVDEVKRIGSNVSPQRFFDYYQKYNWCDKSGKPIEWKQKLKDWGTYNLEKGSTPSKNAPATCDFSNDTSFKNMVKDFVAENKAKEEVA